MEFTYKTSKGTGTVELTLSANGYNAEINGVIFPCDIKQVKQGRNFTPYFQVEGTLLNKALSFAPKTSKKIALVLVTKESALDIKNTLNGKAKTETVKGKFYNGTFWSDEKVAQMTYTEKVFCGVHSE